jgi:hypothetical protein
LTAAAIPTLSLAAIAAPEVRPMIVAKAIEATAEAGGKATNFKASSFPNDAARPDQSRRCSRLDDAP